MIGPSPRTSRGYWLVSLSQGTYKIIIIGLNFTAEIFPEEGS
jgi:hypothetical protein